MSKTGERMRWRRHLHRWRKLTLSVNVFSCWQSHEVSLSFEIFLVVRSHRFSYRLFLLLLLTFETARCLTSADPNDDACLKNLRQSLEDSASNLGKWTNSVFSNLCTGFTSYLQPLNMVALNLQLTSEAYFSVVMMEKDKIGIPLCDLITCCNNHFDSYILNYWVQYEYLATWPYI